MLRRTSELVMTMSIARCGLKVKVTGQGQG